MDFLNKFCIPHGIITLVKTQLKNLFEHFKAGQSQSDQELKLRWDNLEQKRKHLQIRHGMGEIDKETYDLTCTHINEEMQRVSQELTVLTPQLSNLDKLISVSLEKLEKLSIIWASNDLEQKRWMHKTLFPEGVYYDAENHQYLTTTTNGFLSLTRSIAEEYNQNKNGNFQFLLENSRSVVPARIELASKV